MVDTAIMIVGGLALLVWNIGTIAIFKESDRTSRMDNIISAFAIIGFGICIGLFIIGMNKISGNTSLAVYVSGGLSVLFSSIQSFVLSVTKRKKLAVISWALVAVLFILVLTK